MICTTDDRKKFPLEVIRKVKKPHYLRLVLNGISSLLYMDHTNVWFDRKVNLWWVNSAFWSCHISNHGNVMCILLLNNCTSHDIDISRISSKMIFLFLTLNTTNKYQPADMEMISSIKVG